MGLCPIHTIFCRVHGLSSTSCQANGTGPSSEWAVERTFQNISFLGDQTTIVQIADEVSWRTSSLRQKSIKICLSGNGHVHRIEDLKWIGNTR